MNDKPALTPAELTNLLKSIRGENEVKDPTQFRYVVYARKSTESEERQVRSLSDQIAECEQMAESRDLTVIGRPIRESESAKEPNIRLEFRKMVEGLKKGKYDGIVAWHPDRLARNMKDAGELIDLLDKGIITDL